MRLAEFGGAERVKGKSSLGNGFMEGKFREKEKKEQEEERI